MAAFDTASRSTARWGRTRPSDAIADYADRTDADAVCVGHRGLSEEREQVVGSVAKSVVDTATVPVTVIR